jgi:hypothetical protein
MATRLGDRTADPTEPGAHEPLTRTISIAAILAAIAMPASAQPLPQPKVGQCPSGYRESVGYCAPTSDPLADSGAKAPRANSAPAGSCRAGLRCSLGTWIGASVDRCSPNRRAPRLWGMVADGAEGNGCAHRW